MGKEKASSIFDYLRATIVMADPALLAMFYWVLKREWEVVRVKNKHRKGKTQASYHQPPNLHVNVCFHGHVAEIQLILEDFIMIKEYSHKPFEVLRIGLDDPTGDNVKQGKELDEAVTAIVSAGVYLEHPGSVDYPTGSA